MLKREIGRRGLFCGSLVRSAPSRSQRRKSPKHGDVNADIRGGRSSEQRRKLAIGFMEEIHTLCEIPLENMYVIFTEHPGESFHMYDRVLSSWQVGEGPGE